MSERNQKKYKDYDRLVKRLTPGSDYMKGYIRAFWVGGTICALGQSITLWAQKALGMTESPAGMLTSVCLIFFGVLLTGIGVYDDIGRYAGAGSIVPITGFANSVASPAMEFRREGLVLGLGARLFFVAGPVLTYGIASSALAGIIFWAMGRIRG